MIAALLLASCGRTESPVAPATSDPIAANPAQWDMQSSGEGAALVVDDNAGKTELRLFCPAGTGKLLVNVPEFDPIGSEERLSFGQGGEAEALVADSSGDSARGGVTGEGPVPENLTALLSGRVSASYGAQVSGPHPAPPADLVTAFAGACSDGGNPPPESTDASPSTPAGVSPCLTQDGDAIPANSLRAIGTEPFWGARVKGRCVTYSHPQDQSGTRVWTKFSGSAANGAWSGSLDGQPFVMRTRPQAGCSDGMSDNRFPIAVSLTVGGEQRSGCAEPR
jgi:uncharacterized membrane protein